MIKLLSLAAIVFASASALNFTQKDKAIASTTLSNDGNGFALSSESFESSESFVYTATINFQSGQAAGLAFGSQDHDHYFVFNIDRFENRTKLLYFTEDNGNIGAREYLNEYYMGNDKVTESELNVINPKVRECREYHLKVVVTIENEHAYAEFYIDNIKRFGVDRTIDLNALNEGLSYQGGYLGYNVFNASVSFADITVGESDYSYYTEAYRNQYHYSQYAHWNNDPNGLVYYNGYYHMYYQTHPYSQYWDHMYWGHARSTDMVHWQELPYALFPDDGNMGVGLGVGYAWSGIAMVYHPGMSDYIDAQNWFPNGGGTGLLGYYTRDGMMQDQVIISSDDEGLTWTKREIISQYLIHEGNKIDCRDPSIFALTKDYSGKVTRWGMALSGAVENKFWFLTSTDMVHWEYAGGYYYIYPECMSVYTLANEKGETYHAISVSSREYAVGHLYYNEYERNVEFVLSDGRLYSNVGQSAFRKMEYAEDSYAAQAFYIDDESSKYYGKTVAVSWYSGLPSDAESGSYAAVRKPWNGGMTIPVQLGLVGEGADIALTQTPITLGNEDFDKTNIISAENADTSAMNSLFERVNTHVFELNATIANPARESVEFRVASSEDEYTAFGWNKNDGYYFDRSHTSTAGISFVKNYSHKFTTGLGEGSTLSFYVLCDNGGIEIFAEGFRYAFYGLTLAAPYSIGASFHAGSQVTVTSIEMNAIGSIWHDDAELEEGVLYLDQESLSLDLSLFDSKDILVYSTNHEEISYQIVSGEDVVEFTPISKGVRVHAIGNGEAEIQAITQTQSKSIYVTVDDAEVDCDYALNKQGIKSGTWRKSSEGLVATMPSGDGYYLSDTAVSDFQYSANISLEGTAAGLVVRANKDMSDFIVCNIDANEHIAKVFSPKGEIARGHVDIESLENLSYSLSLVDSELDVMINGKKAVHASLPYGGLKSGYVGLNVFNGKATFNDIHLSKLGYDFVGEDLEVENAGGQYIYAIYNQTNKNTLVNPAYYSYEGEKLILSKAYFALLEEGETYRFYVSGAASSFGFTVNVITRPSEVVIEDKTINEGLDVVVRIDKLPVISVSVNGASLGVDKYSVKDYCLRIDKSAFRIGSNNVIINGNISFQVLVTALSSGEAGSRSNQGHRASAYNLAWIAPIGLGLGLVATLVVIRLISHKKESKNE